MASIEEKVEILLKPIIETIGYELYDVEYTKEGKNYFLRIFIDSEKGINIDDCEKVNNEITGILDEADYIKEMYFLEVSSSGIERVLKKESHLQKNIGKEVSVKLFKKDEFNIKEYQGLLKKCIPETISLILGNNKEVEITRKNISQIKTIYNWENGGK